MGNAAEVFGCVPGNRGDDPTCMKDDCRSLPQRPPRPIRNQHSRAVPSTAVPSLQGKMPTAGGKSGKSEGIPTPRGRVYSDESICRTDSFVKRNGTLLLGKYLLSEAADDKLGEGTYCMVRRGTNVETGEQVAIKLCKLVRERGRGDADAEDAMLRRFRRQVMVLQELHQPFVPPADPDLWNAELAEESPSDLFVRMLDYSKDENGEPGPMVGDGRLFVVLEIAQHSLKAFLRGYRQKSMVLPKEVARFISRRILFVVAALHAKGLVHLDFKPDNLMLFGENWKLIDVDGCLRAGTSATLEDTAIYYSPCYCSPEMARFLIQETKGPINILPSLDVWSVGMVICELAHLDAILKPKYALCTKKAHSNRHACRLFLAWVGSTDGEDLVPPDVEEFDPGLWELVCNWLLVRDFQARRSLAQSLSAPYVADAARTAPLPDALREVLPDQMATQLEELCGKAGLTLYARPSTPRLTANSSQSISTPRYSATTPRDNN